MGAIGNFSPAVRLFPGTHRIALSFDQERR
jgi:hypothetical protein